MILFCFYSNSVKYTTLVKYNSPDIIFFFFKKIFLDNHRFLSKKFFWMYVNFLALLVIMK